MKVRCIGTAGVNPAYSRHLRGTAAMHPAYKMTLVKMGACP